jgi:hypothetical protein
MIRGNICPYVIPECAISIGCPVPLVKTVVRRVKTVHSSIQKSEEQQSTKALVTCLRRDCSKFHPRSTRKKNRDGSTSLTSATRKMKPQSSKQNNDAAPKSSDFLELRSLVTGMAAKLEALEKKIDQSAPSQSHQPLTQPVGQMRYPVLTAPHMMNLGVPRLPHHQILIALTTECTELLSFNPSTQSAGRWKLQDLVGHLDEQRELGHVFPFIAITESWLKSYHSDDQLQVPGYSLARSDRSKRTGGGVMLYSLTSLSVSVSETLDDSVCQGVISVSPLPDSAWQSLTGRLMQVQPASPK